MISVKEKKNRCPFFLCLELDPVSVGRQLLSWFSRLPATSTPHAARTTDMSAAHVPFS